MTWHWVAAVLLGVLLQLTTPAATAATASVVELTDDNFDKLTSDGSAWLVDVYAPWYVKQVFVRIKSEAGQGGASGS